MNNFKPGDTVQYTSYGVVCTAKIVRIGTNGNNILHLDNGRWMFASSCTLIETLKG